MQQWKFTIKPLTQTFRFCFKKTETSTTYFGKCLQVIPLPCCKFCQLNMQRMLFWVFELTLCGVTYYISSGVRISTFFLPVYRPVHENSFFQSQLYWWWSNFVVLNYSSFDRNIKSIVELKKMSKCSPKTF